MARRPKNLNEQLQDAGLSPEEATQTAENFVAGLKELGLSDEPAEPTPAVFSINEAPVAPTPAVQKTAIVDPSLVKALVGMGVTLANANLYAAPLSATMNEFQINNKQRKAMFLAQILHESGKMSQVSENLNYSEQRLLEIFKKYFDRATAARYARNPAKIANRVYANRMGNGSEDSGDGFRYRGRGLIQLTGKFNYAAAGKALGKDLLANPDYLLTPEGACRSAGWFWNSRNLNTVADRGDIRTNTRLINGGFIGLDDRTALYNKALKLL